MRSKRLHLIITTLAASIFFGCGKTTEEFTTEHLSEYLPVQVGKYITYRLDSTVFTNFGATTEVHSFQEKHVVDAEFTDAAGRTSYRIFRFTRDTAGTQPWTPAGSYSITPGDSAMEVIENNLRFIKLVLPIKQDNTWKGNRYLPDNAFSSLYSFNNDFGMDDWDYTYSSLGESLMIGGKAYNNVLIVDGIDETLNANRSNYTVTDPKVYGSVNYLQDIYAKGIGLIAQQFIMWDYQPPNGTNSTGSKVGFGIRRSIIDHN
jgi:hypothetical protein